MTLRTVKKHFTALSGYCQWLEGHGVLPRASNIFADREWLGTKSRHDDRDDWSVNDPNTLLRSSWFAPEKRGTDYWWATVEAMRSLRSALGTLKAVLDESQRRILDDAADGFGPGMRSGLR